MIGLYLTLTAYVDLVGTIVGAWERHHMDPLFAVLGSDAEIWCFI